MINDPYNCLYIHMPKTAGNSVNRLFGMSWQNHKDLGRYSLELGVERCLAYHRFAIVRNPWDRLLSEYNFQRRKSRPDASRLHIFDKHGRERRFSEWVRVVFDDPFRYPASTWGGEVSPHIHRWSPQVDWLSLGGKLAIDSILRLECLPKDITALQRRLGMPTRRMPHRNWKFHWHYSRYYDEPTRELVRRFYASDLRAFAYDFEAPSSDASWLLQWAWSRFAPRAA